MRLTASLCEKYLPFAIGRLPQSRCLSEELKVGFVPQS